MNFRTKILVKILRTFYKDYAIAWNTYHPKGIGILIKKPRCILKTFTSQEKKMCTVWKIRNETV